MTNHLNELDLLAAAGVTVSLDFDNTLEFDVPEELYLARLRAYLFDHATELAQNLLARHKYERRVFSGGPFDGQLHGRSVSWSIGHSVKIARGRWAAYCTLGRYDDGRLVYCGEATSEKKARKLALDTYVAKYMPAGARAPRK